MTAAADGDEQRRNEWGQPVGPEVPGWTPPPALPPLTRDGRWCRVEPLRAEHADDLAGALVDRSPASIWTYLPWDPPGDTAGMRRLVAGLLARPGWLPHAVVVEGRPLGIACYLRVDPVAGSAEIGGIVLGAGLQRRTAATEAISVLLEAVFEHGYRRCEWKCDALNEPSRRAAIRLGFRYEGTFRQALVYKGRNRDTAWFAITEDRWPAVRDAHRSWLATDNVGGAAQRRSLSEFTAHT